MNIFLVSMTIIAFATRGYLVSSVWRLPLKHGKDFFLAQPVQPGFYQEAGAPLLGRYHILVFLPLVLDAPLALWLAATQRYFFALVEQWIALMLTIVAYNIMVLHFSVRAGNIAEKKEAHPATLLQLSMEPRRLREHSDPIVEVAVAGATLLALALLAGGYLLAIAGKDGHAGAHLVQEGVVVLTWILYMQVGLLLLKLACVRWRMPLPVHRTDDFRRWRAACLRWNLKMLDSIRMLMALALPWGVITRMAYPKGWTPGAAVIAVCVWAPLTVVSMVHISREGRRLKEVEREVKPVELVKEFPRPPVPDGLFLAGGLLYFNRDNPQTIVRSVRGIAINLARPSPYVWAGYFIGLSLISLLTAWQVR